MSTQGWTLPQTAGDWISRTEKRISSLERRDGSVGQTVSIIGPGQNKRAALIEDWNDPIASFNGYYWSEPGARHAPDAIRVWTGNVVGRTDNSGMQQVWNTDDLDDVRYYMRTFIDDGTGQRRIYSDWRAFATPTGFIELPDLGDTVDDLLADMAAEIDTKSASLLLYEQDDEPVPGVSGVPTEIPVGSVWVDTNDNRHTYSWDGTAWVSIESTLFGDIETELGLLTTQVEAAADSAADALDLVVLTTKVYIQTTEPTNPDADGRPLVVGDEWFDTDFFNLAWRWNGIAWVTADYGLIAPTVTGGLYQTTADSGRGLKMNSAGMVFYAPSPEPADTEMFVLDAATGAITMQGPLLTDSDITGGVVTGAHLRTHTGATVGIHMTTGGLIGYDASNVATFSLDAATGVLTLAGGVLTGGSLTGGVVTGGTLQSEATTGRGIKINSSGLVLYAPSPTAAGTAMFTLDATTGNVVLAGTLTGGGTITGPAFQTASSGERIVVRNDGSGGVIEFFSGVSGETAGRMDPFVSGTRVGVSLQTGGTATYPDQPYLHLLAGNNSSAGNESHAWITAYRITLGGYSGGYVTIGEAFVDIDVEGSVAFSGGNLTGPGFDTWLVACTANANPTSATNVTITGLSQVVPVQTYEATGAVFLVTIDADWSIATAGTIAIIELLVDGTAQGVQMLLYGSSVGRWACSKTWRITGLAAGNHTFSARTRNTAGLTSSIVNATHTTMTVQRVS